MNKPKALLLTLCASLAFGANADSIFGWFGKSAGDDGKANTVGNPSAKVQNTVFNINNRLISDVSSVSVIDAKGKVIYSNSFLCKSGKRCTLNLTNLPLNSNLTFKFLNAKNELVGAYLISRTSDVNSVILDESWLGIYVFNQMVKISKQKPLDLNSKLTKAFAGFSSPDNTPDIFEELGMYFIAQNGGANESKFYKDLAQKLSSNQRLMTLSTNKSTSKNIVGNKAVNLNLQVSKASPPPSTDVCDPSVKSSLSYVQNIAGFIPVVGNVFGALLGIGGQVLSDACPTKMDPDVASKFAEIDNRLNKLDEQFNSLNYTVADLQKYINQSEAENVLLDMYKSESSIKNQYIKQYTNLTSSGSLSSYVKQNGGLKKAFANSKILQDLLTNLPYQMSEFQNLVPDGKIQKMKGALDNMCSDPSKISDDIISTRIGCDMVISRVVFTIGYNALKMKTMLDDEATVIADAIKSGDVDRTWLTNNVGVKLDGIYDWDKTSDFISQVDTKVNFVKNTLIGESGSKLYKPLDGLSPTLQQNIMAAGCVSDKLSDIPNSESLPAITKWVTIHSKGKDSPYVATQCSDGNGNKVNSQYFYYKRGTSEIDDKIVNVMGILVPDRFFHGGSQNNYGYDPAFPWANYSHIHTAPDSYQVSNWHGNDYGRIGDYDTVAISFDDRSAVGELRMPVSSTAAAIGFSPANVNKTLIAQGGYTEDFKRNNKDYKREVFTSSTAGNYRTFNLKYRGADYWQIEDSEYFSFVSYKPESGYAKTWVIRSKIVKSSGDLILNATSQCATNDCKAIDTGKTLDKIEFGVDNTSIEWVKSGSGIYSMTVNGSSSF